MSGRSDAAVGEAVFRGYDQAELDRQYDHRAWAPDAREIIARYRVLSDEVHAKLAARRNVSYGASPGQTLDIFPAARAASGLAPVLMFIHGGQWQRLSKDDSAFAAPAFTAAGAAFVAVNFDLIPAVPLDEIVRQNREAVAWVRRNAADFGGDAARIHVAGHSSGAHIAAMLATTDWAEFGLGPDPLRGAACVSGTYDVGPLMLSFRAGYLELDEAGVARNSPIRHLDRLRVPLIVSTGEFESDEFRRHGADLADAARAAGGDCSFIPVAGLNHFEMVLELADPASPLTRAVLQQMAL